MFTHINSNNQPQMVDVGHKKITKRLAEAQAIVKLPKEILCHFDGNDIQSKKGPVIATAIIAGTMAVKKTGDFIPFCHPLGIDNCSFKIELLENIGLQIRCTVEVEGKTGVEMEALTGASVASLTVYDMCKALSPEIEIAEVYLLRKKGGKKDYERGSQKSNKE